MNLKFIPIKEKHLTIVKEIYDYFILNSTATFHTDKISLEDLKDVVFINHNKYKSFLIEYNDNICGYCFLTQFKKRQAYDCTAEVTIYLKPDCQGQNIGTNTMKFMEQTAKEVGIKNLIGIITGNNKSSIKLFENVGYLKCAHFKNVGSKFGEILDVVAYQLEIN